MPANATTFTPVDLDGIGDIVDAGQATSYPELRQPSSPTVGQLMSAAESVAELLTSSTSQSGPDGVWQEYPLAEALQARAVVLQPSQFAPLPGARCVRGGGVLYLAQGQAHMVVMAAEGQLLAVHTLTAHRGRSLASPEAHQVINTGDTPVLLVHVIGQDR